MMTTDGVGLYIHIPFCKSKCKYCDFKSFPNLHEDIREKYIDTLISELSEYAAENRRIKTIFFGGGTPSLLTEWDMQRIVKGINESFKADDNIEFTIEANPKTVTVEKLRTFASLGVNRISVGLQSIHENELKSLGRIHTYSDFLSSYEDILRSGIDNINVDLMYGIPHETLSTLDKTLDAVIALDIPHISAYGLIIEEGTPFFDMQNELPLPGEDEEADMYELITRRLGDSGYRHYEISNYAKEGYECRHNLIYWHDEEYIGVGLSAHSYLDGKRYSNTGNLAEYLSEGYRAYRNSITLDENDKEFEYAMMNFRLADGLSLRDYGKRFGKEFLEGREERINKYIRLGLISRENDRLFLTERGFYLSNTILSDLL